VASITDDWRYPMLTPPNGNVDYLPVTGEARRVTEMSDPGCQAGVTTTPNTTLDGHSVRLVDTGGQEYLAVTTTVDDPICFQPPYIKTSEFKKQADATGWSPSPCTAK
jgi:hypothetical protein